MWCDGRGCGDGREGIPSRYMDTPPLVTATSRTMSRLAVSRISLPPVDLAVVRPVPIGRTGLFWRSRERPPPLTGAGSSQRPPKRGGRCHGYRSGRSLLIYPSGKGGLMPERLVITLAALAAVLLVAATGPFLRPGRGGDATLVARCPVGLSGFREFQVHKFGRPCPRCDTFHRWAPNDPRDPYPVGREVAGPGEKRGKRCSAPPAIRRDLRPGSRSTRGPR